MKTNFLDDLRLGKGEVAVLTYCLHMQKKKININLDLLFLRFRGKDSLPRYMNNLIKYKYAIRERKLRESANGTKCSTYAYEFFDTVEGDLE